MTREAGGVLTGRLGGRHLGIGARVTAAFAFGALLLSLTLALLTHGVASSYLLRQREASTLRQAVVNASLVRIALRQSDPPVAEALGTLQTPADTAHVVAWADGWTSSSVEIGPRELPPALRDEVMAGTAARQRFLLDGEKRLVVGVPLPEVGGAYFEVFSLAELDATLRTLLASLLAAGAVTTVAGALVGRWASGVALRPLSDASEAAQAIAGGRLDTRLPPGDDASLNGLASSFNAMADALEERTRRDARFASDISHELRSPLTTLAATTEVLAGRRDELGERARRAVDLLSAEVAHFQRLVEDLLEISRADAGTIELAIEEVRLAELAVRSGPVARARLRVAEAPGAEGARVRVDKRRFEQVVTNLVNNATSHGGGVERVAVEAGADPGHVRLVVEDAGPGVPVTERERIFERFSRGGAGGDRGASEGAGLGLALVREHVKVHGGRTWVEQRPGGGARFVVELPRAESGGGPGSER